MDKLLIDTSVWLNLAKDHRQEFFISALEEMVRTERLALILPRTVLDEFARNKTRVADEGGRSALAAVRRTRELLERFGVEGGKEAALDQLREVEHRIPTLGETALATLQRVEQLFGNTP